MNQPESDNNQLSNIAVAYVDKVDTEQAKRIAKQFNFQYLGDAAAATKQPNLDFLLQVNVQTVELCKLDEPKLGAIKVDFVEGH